MNLQNQYAKLGISICLVAALLGGCAIRFVSDYDEQTEKSVTALQKKVDTFLIKLQYNDKPPACLYEKHKGFYEEAKVDLSGIQVRGAAIPKNTLTTEQLELLADSLSKLEKLDQIKGRRNACLSQEEIEPVRANLNTSFTAILKLELAKKRGEID